MKKIITCLFLLLIIKSTVSAQNETPADSLDYHRFSNLALTHNPSTVVLDEINVTSSRENKSFKNQPVAYSFIPAAKIESTNMNSLHDLSMVVPNFTMPDYGSKITSSIYVRGIGSRMNEPSVGLYVDDIPYLDKSAFDLGFYDIKDIALLRGPQGTLYGRNTIGGLIKINTLSPLDYQGTRAFASYGNANDQLYKLSHYQKIGNNVGISLAGYYHHNDGFFTNEFNGKKDYTESFGARFKTEWRMNQKWNMKLSAVYDNTSQRAYPYAAYDVETGEVGAIDYNENGTYKRELFNTGLSFQRKSSNLLFTSASSFQYLDDQMKIDQDFTADSILALTQNQKINNVTQEFVFRSRGDSKYQWVAGAFGFYKKSNVDAPMIFREGALSALVENLPPFIVSQEADFPGKFDIPAYGSALYHQSSYTFWNKLTLTAGIRFEYEQTSMDYNTSAEMVVNVTPPSPRPMTIPYHVGDTIQGKVTQDFFGVLPKVAAKYDFNDKYNIYASVSRGYKTGGFNFQMFSDVLRQELMNQMPSVPHYETDADIKDIIAYKPEYTINYEIGTHSEIISKKLYVDAALFYIDYTNQQIVTFASTNMGNRRTENAGRSESLGAEATIVYNIFENLSANVSYGYTKATFKKYNTGEHDFAGNYIPLVPQNTFSVSADYRLKINRNFLDQIVFRAQYNGAGKIYFTENNNVSRNYYGLLNGSISFEKGKFNLNCWTKNALNEEYIVFYFTSLNNSFVQQGKPRQFGISAQMKF